MFLTSVFHVFRTPIKTFWQDLVKFKSKIMQATRTDSCMRLAPHMHETPLILKHYLACILQRMSQDSCGILVRESCKECTDSCRAWQDSCMPDNHGVTRISSENHAIIWESYTYCQESCLVWQDSCQESSDSHAWFVLSDKNSAWKIPPLSQESSKNHTNAMSEPYKYMYSVNILNN